MHHQPAGDSRAYSSSHVSFMRQKTNDWMCFLSIVYYWFWPLFPYGNRCAKSVADCFEWTRNQYWMLFHSSFCPPIWRCSYLFPPAKSMTCSMQCWDERKPFFFYHSKFILFAFDEVFNCFRDILKQQELEETQIHDIEVQTVERWKNQLNVKAFIVWAFSLTKSQTHTGGQHVHYRVLKRRKVQRMAQDQSSNYA